MVRTDVVMRDRQYRKDGLVTIQSTAPECWLPIRLQKCFCYRCGRLQAENKAA